MYKKGVNNTIGNYQPTKKAKAKKVAKKTAKKVAPKKAAKKVTETPNQFVALSLEGYMDKKGKVTFCELTSLITRNTSKVEFYSSAVKTLTRELVNAMAEQNAKPKPKKSK